MEKAPSDYPSTDFIEKTGPISPHDHTRSLAKADVEAEHQLTFRAVWKNHKAIIWWSFFWAMCAIGWFVFRSLLLLSRGDAKLSLVTEGGSMLRLMER
jgi:hypothetical protein